MLFGMVRRTYRVGEGVPSGAAKRAALGRFGLVCGFQAATRYSLMSPVQVVVRLMCWSSSITAASP